MQPSKYFKCCYIHRMLWDHTNLFAECPGAYLKLVTLFQGHHHIHVGCCLSCSLATFIWVKLWIHLPVPENQHSPGYILFILSFHVWALPEMLIICWHVRHMGTCVRFCNFSVCTLSIDNHSVSAPDSFWPMLFPLSEVPSCHSIYMRQEGFLAHPSRTEVKLSTIKIPCKYHSE